MPPHLTPYSQIDSHVNVAVAHGLSKPVSSSSTRRRAVFSSCIYRVVTATETSVKFLVLSLFAVNHTMQPTFQMFNCRSTFDSPSNDLHFYRAMPCRARLWCSKSPSVRLWTWCSLGVPWCECDRILLNVAYSVFAIGWQRSINLL